MTSPALTIPRRARVIDADGYLTLEFARFLEELSFRMKKFQEAAEDYSTLATGTVTVGETAAELNTLISNFLET